MRVKVLSRNPADYLRETKKDIHKGAYFLLHDTLSPTPHAFLYEGLLIHFFITFNREFGGVV